MTNQPIVYTKAPDTWGGYVPLVAAKHYKAKAEAVADSLSGPGRYTEDNMKTIKRVNALIKRKQWFRLPEEIVLKRVAEGGIVII